MSALIVPDMFSESYTHTHRTQKYIYWKLCRNWRISLKQFDNIHLRTVLLASGQCQQSVKGGDEYTVKEGEYVHTVEREGGKQRVLNLNRVKSIPPPLRLCKFGDIWPTPEPLSAVLGTN